MTLEDRNVTYVALDGIDPQPRANHSEPERILLRVFLAAMQEYSGSLTASSRDPEDQILVRGSISRESLDAPPQFGVTGNPLHHFVCMAAPWRPQFFLRSAAAGA